MKPIEISSEFELEEPSARPSLSRAFRTEIWIKFFNDIIRKSFVLLFSLTLTNSVSLAILGLINRLLGRPLRSVFLCYPAKEKYAHKYAFSWAFEYMRYNPLIVGIYFQNFRVGLILASYVQENYFRNNKEYLALIQSKMNRIRNLVGAELVHFSGTLPSEMNRLSLIEPGYFKERCDLVAEIVIDAERAVRLQQDIFEICPVLLLGGGGSIGSVLKEKFLGEGREVHIIDRDDVFPIKLIGQKAVLIDVSRKGVLESRIDQLWSDITILNESFPEPDQDIVKILNRKGITVYHVAGVKATAFPPFPYGYAGGIPCCAAIREKKMKSLIKKL